MMVIPASRMLSAISFGVFCRSAPSTRAIIRSRKVEPAAAVILTLIRSEITWVPPVTAERSPPLSRITGADSPVMAASLTLATPSMTSPSPGIRSPASTSTTSPGLSASAETSVQASPAVSASRFADASVRVRRRLAAWALPRPSATASAKLANSSVIHSQPTICGGDAEVGAADGEIADEERGCQHGDDGDDEHHRVAGEASGIELAHGA